MRVFKGQIGGLDYYFKPKGDNEYLIEPYRHKETKPFKIVKRTLQDIDELDKREWLIPESEVIPNSIRERELDFSDYIQEKLGYSE